MEDTHKIARNGVAESSGHLPTAPTFPLFEQSGLSIRGDVAPLSKDARDAQCETGVQHIKAGSPLAAPDIAHARNSDPQHSHEAAKSVINIGPTKEGILQVLRLYGPSTDERIALMYRGLRAMGKQLPESSPSGLRSRRAWLVQNGFVVEAGTGKTASGRPCAIWRMK